MNATKMRPEIIAGVFYGEINGEDREPHGTAQAVANVLEELRRKTGFPQPEDESDYRLMYFHAASRWLGENALRRAEDSKSSIRQAKAEGYTEVENLSRHHAVMNARDLDSQWMFHALAQDSELSADVQSVYAGALSRIRSEGITVENLNPVQVQRTMNSLAACVRIHDIDQRSSSAAMAALEVARLVSLSLRTTAAKLSGDPQWGREIGDSPGQRSEALRKFTAECYALAAASLYLIGLLLATG